MEKRGKGAFEWWEKAIPPFSIPTEFILHLWCYLFVGGERGQGKGTF